MVNKIKIWRSIMKKLKKLLSISCSILALTFTMSASYVSADSLTVSENNSSTQTAASANTSYDFTYNGGAYKILDSSYVSFMGVVDSSVKSFSLPSRVLDTSNYQYYLISQIGDPEATMPGTNSGLMNLETIESIPGSVIAINNFAFYGGKLKSINLSNLNGLTKINYSAFANCPQLQTVKLPPYMTTIENSAFAGCTSLTSFVIYSDGKGECKLNKISPFAFSNCSSLRLLNIPFSTSLTIENNAFANMSATQSNPVEIALGNSINSSYYYSYITIDSAEIEQLKNKTLCFSGYSSSFILKDTNGNVLKWDGTML